MRSGTTPPSPGYLDVCDDFEIVALLEICEQPCVRGLPLQQRACRGAGRGIVDMRERAEKPEVLGGLVRRDARGRKRWQRRIRKLLILKGPRDSSPILSATPVKQLIKKYLC